MPKSETGERGPALASYVKAQGARDDAHAAVLAALSTFEAKAMGLRDAADRLDRSRNPDEFPQQFTHDELRCLLDAVSQYLENEDPEDDETKVPGHPAAHSARLKLEAYFASFADEPPPPDQKLPRAIVNKPRHPLDGTAVGVVRRDPFKRFVIGRVLEDVGDYGAGTDVRFMPGELLEDAAEPA